MVKVVSGVRVAGAGEIQLQSIIQPTDICADPVNHAFNAEAFGPAQQVAVQPETAQLDAAFGVILQPGPDSAGRRFDHRGRNVERAVGVRRFGLAHGDRRKRAGGAQPFGGAIHIIGAEHLSSRQARDFDNAVRAHGFLPLWPQRPEAQARPGGKRDRDIQRLRAMVGGNRLPGWRGLGVALRAPLVQRSGGGCANDGAARWFTCGKIARKLCSVSQRRDLRAPESEGRTRNHGYRDFANLVWWRQWRDIGRLAPVDLDRNLRRVIARLVEHADQPPVFGACGRKTIPAGHQRPVNRPAR